MTAGAYWLGGVVMGLKSGPDQLYSVRTGIQLW